MSWLLSDTGHVITTAFVDNSGGGASGTITAGSALMCRVDALGGSEGEVAGRISDRSTHLVTLPPDSAVTTNDDFSVIGRGTFEVTAVREHSDELARFIEVVLKT